MLVFAMLKGLLFHIYMLPNKKSTCIYELTCLFYTYNEFRKRAAQHKKIEKATIYIIHIMSIKI